MGNEYRKRKLRQYVASKIACKEITYKQALESLERNKVFDNWDEWELYNRPIDVDELRECVEQELGI